MSKAAKRSSKNTQKALLSLKGARPPLGDITNVNQPSKNGKKVSTKDNAGTSTQGSNSPVNRQRKAYTKKREIINAKDKRGSCEPPSDFLEETDIPHKVPVGVRDLDYDNWDDPLAVSVYAMDIFNYLKSRERKFTLGGMKSMKEVTGEMRRMVVSWMLEVQENYELDLKHAFLAIKLMDMFLAKTPEMAKEDFQLLGVTSIWISTKYEGPEWRAAECIYMCDGAYTGSDLLRMEKKMLKALNHDVGIPVAYTFLTRYAMCDRVSEKTLTLGRYILELCLLECSLVGVSDSKIAAAALLLAKMMTGLHPWNKTLVYYTGYKLDDLIRMAQKVNKALHRGTLDGIEIKKKYSHPMFHEVSKIPLLDIIKFKRKN